MDIDFKKLSKDKLEDIGRDFGLELDKRYSKGKLVGLLNDHIESLDKDELEALGRSIHGVELDKRKSLADLKSQIIEADANDVVTSRINSKFTWGSKFSDYALAKWHLKRHGGKLVQEGKYYFLNK